MTRHALIAGLAAAGLLVTVSCQPQPQPAPPASKTAAAQAPTGMGGMPPRAGAAMPDFGRSGGTPTIRGKVVETMDASRYTYVRVDTGTGSEVWAAAPQFPVAIGDEVLISTDMPMQDHESTTLGRKFDLVYFTSEIPIVGAGGKAPPLSGMGDASAMTLPPGHPEMPTPEPEGVPTDFSDVKKADGGLTIAEINEQAASLEGQQVTFRGKVVKFTGAVMGHNWIHVKDGTGGQGTDDLTVTTDDTPAVGQTVLVRGTVVTKQDFGFGYAYDVLVKDATAQVE